MGKSYDLPNPPGPWTYLGPAPESDLAQPRSSRAGRDFAAADQSPPDQRPARRRVAGDLDEIQLAAAELVSKAEGITFTEAARKIPRDPGELRRLLAGLKTRKTTDPRRETT